MSREKKKRRRGAEIREFLLTYIPFFPRNIVNMAVKEFSVSRQAIHNHLQLLISQGKVIKLGKTRDRRYRLRDLLLTQFKYPIDRTTEDKVWREDIRPLLQDLGNSVLEIWQYGITEMVNNALEHSDGQEIGLLISRNAISASISIEDDGVGIFKKIKSELGLENEEHAILELAKGKLTTDPEKHTGEGIFFTSRIFDSFRITSGKTGFAHYGWASEVPTVFKSQPEEWVISHPDESEQIEGTQISLDLNDASKRDLSDVFNQFAAPNSDYGFTKTAVPVLLTDYGEENLISRSQAKRLLLRFERFKCVLLDFRGVKNIGQAFADEVFRVFPSNHPEVELVTSNTSSEVEKMIQKAKAGLRDEMDRGGRK